MSTMTKNQGSRLTEWVEYHKNLGVTKFIFFLDNCTDNSLEILLSIVNTDIDVHLTSEIYHTSTSWINRSHEMYNFVLKNYSNLDWICFLEVDEFIFPQAEIKFVNYLTSLDTECLYINSWDFKGPFDENKPILGQSYSVWTDEQRFYSEYRYRGKSVINPKKFIECVDAHHFRRNDRTVSSEFKASRENYLQNYYGNEVTIDDNLFRIYHFRNHTPSNMNNYKIINY